MAHLQSCDKTASPDKGWNIVDQAKLLRSSMDLASDCGAACETLGNEVYVQPGRKN